VETEQQLQVVYDELREVASEQRELSRKREALEEQRDHLLYALGRTSMTGARYDVC
jgi:hypothetical protein